MAFKLVVLFAALAVANAGYLGAPAAVSYAAPAVATYAAPASVAVQTPAITSQSSNILRSYGNLGQISTYSKTIDTPFSSVSKSDVRVSNPGYAVAPAVAYAAPAVHTAYAAPAVHAAPVAYAAHGAYAAPVAYGASAVHAAPVAYGAPAVAHSATTITGHGLLGVAYSAAPAVSHMTYSAPALGLTYAY